MAITASLLTEAFSSTAGTTFTTASVTPTANSLQILTVVSGSSTTAITPTVTGCGLTWVAIGVAASCQSGRKVNLYRAMGAAPSAGVITITHSGSQANCSWRLVEFGGVNASGTDGSGAVVQSGRISSDSGTTTTDVSLPSAVTAGNSTYASACLNANSAMTAGVGFVEVGTQTNTIVTTSPVVRLISEFSVGGARTLEVGKPSAPTCGLIGIEVAAAVTAVDATATPAVAAAIAAIPAPTVTTPTSATATPADVAAAASVGAPTVSVTSNATATPAVAAATAAVGAPTTTAAKTATTTPATVAAVSAVAAPVVSTGTKAFPAAAVAIAAVGAPSTSTGTKALPVRVTAASAVAAPTISTGQKAMPTTVVAAAAVGVPTVAATSFATVTPTTIVAAAGVGSPSVTAARAAAATPSTVASAAMVAAPTVSAASNSTATPATAAAAAATGATSTPWTPDLLAGLRVWLKADTISGLADGDPVDAWPDSSGSGHDGAQSSPHQPIYRTNISGGLPAVEFGGAQDIDIAGFGDILSGDDTYTLAILNHPTGSFGNYPIMLTWPTNTIWQWIVEYDTSSGVYWGHTNGSFRLYTTATGIDTWPILALTKTVAADGTFRQSGTDITAYSTNGSGMVATPTMTGPVRMGGYYDHTFSFTGHIAEVIYYSKVLSPTDLAKVEGYLAWKWGRVGDLPGGHTYKTAPPTTAATGAVVTTGESATPATVAAAATISAPAISAGQRSLPATVPATAAVAGPATTTATGGTAHPATVTASTTAATPTVATGSRAVPLTFLATTAVPAPTVHIGTSMVPATVELLAAIGDPGVVTVTVAHITTPVFAVAVGSGRSAAPVAVSAVGAAVAANGRGGVNVDPSSTGSVLSGDGRTLAEVS